MQTLQVWFDFVRCLNRIWVELKIPKTCFSARRRDGASKLCQQDRKWVLVGQEVDDLERVLDNPHRHLLLAWIGRRSASEVHSTTLQI